MVVPGNLTGFRLKRKDPFYLIYNYRNQTQMSISGTIRARGLKFWLQVALGPLMKPCRRCGDPDPGNTENPVFSKIRIFAFFASTDPLGPRGRPRMDRNHLILTRIRKIRFFENPDFSFFRLFKLKDPTIWVSNDSP